MSDQKEQNTQKKSKSRPSNSLVSKDEKTLSPSQMPSDFSISLAAKGGTDNLLYPAGERQQSMRGF